MFIKEYLALSPEDKVIIDERQFEQERTPDDWIEAFKKLEKIDAQGDIIRKVSYWLGVLGVLLIVFGVIGSFVTGSLILFLIIIGIPLAVVGLIIYYKIKNLNLPNDLLKETIIPILYLLKEDIKRNGKVTLKMDLRGFKQDDKSDGVKDVPTNTRHSVTDYFYLDNWMEGKTILADGTKLTWEIEDYIRQRIKNKVGSSGKSKGTETKNKVKTTVTVKAGVHKKNFSLPIGLKQLEEDGKIFTKKVEGQQWMTVKKKFKHAEGEGFVPKHFIDTVAEIYMRAKPLGGK